MCTVSVCADCADAGDRHKECMSTLCRGVIYLGAPDPVTVFALDL